MCTRFYVEPASYQSLITWARKIQLANDIMVKLGKPLTMSGEMHPTDVIAVLAPNKDGKMAVFSVLTRDATEKLRAIHDRMPLILRRDDVATWVRSDGNPKEIAENGLTEMCWEKTNPFDEKIR